MKITERKLRRIIKNVIRESMDPMEPMDRMSPMDDMEYMDPMDCNECQLLCKESDSLRSALAEKGCHDVEAAQEFFALLDRFRTEVFTGPMGSWSDAEGRIESEYDTKTVKDLYHMCMKYRGSHELYHALETATF